MYFETGYELLLMGKHGIYVWSVTLITISTLLFHGWYLHYMKRKVMKKIKKYHLNAQKQKPIPPTFMPASQVKS
ncbi:MAG: hypothetical protein HAW62_01335 [Endozoicomonadaceae bacterium]|nr:hypothetical protein [Endozoicomonadaceae bacterium]